MLASIDTFETDIALQNDFMEFNFDNRLYAKASLYWINLMQILTIGLSPKLTWNRFDSDWFKKEAPGWFKILSAGLLVFLILFPISLNMLLKYLESREN